MDYKRADAENRNWCTVGLRELRKRLKLTRFACCASNQGHTSGGDDKE